MRAVSASHTACHRHNTAFRRVVDDGTTKATCPPALRREGDDTPSPALLAHNPCGGPAKEKARFEVKINLKIPIFFGDFIYVVLAAQDSSKMSQNVDRTKFIACAVHQRVTPRQFTQISATSDMPLPFHTGPPRFNGLLIEIDRHHAGAGRRERLGNLAANAASRAGHNDAFSFQSRANTPGHTCLLFITISLLLLRCLC